MLFDLETQTVQLGKPIGHALLWSFCFCSDLFAAVATALVITWTPGINHSPIPNQEFLKRALDPYLFLPLGWSAHFYMGPKSHSQNFQWQGLHRTWLGIVLDYLIARKIALAFSARTRCCALANHCSRHGTCVGLSTLCLHHVHPTWMLLFISLQAVIFSTASALPDFPRRSRFLNLWQFLLSRSHCWSFLSSTIKCLAPAGSDSACMIFWHHLPFMLLIWFPVYNSPGFGNDQSEPGGNREIFWSCLSSYTWYTPQLNKNHLD